jgi:hypothetical protein
LRLLEEIGRLRQAREAERGGVSLRIPAQQIERWTTAMTGYRLAFETSSEVEAWNAQISLTTGIASARRMIECGAGLPRALDPPQPERVQALRLTARALGVAWPDAMDYDDFVRGLDPHDAVDAVMLHQSARVTGGAYYAAFAGEPPSHARREPISPVLRSKSEHTTLTHRNQPRRNEGHEERQSESNENLSSRSSFLRGCPHLLRADLAGIARGIRKRQFVLCRMRRRVYDPSTVPATFTSHDKMRSGSFQS